MEKYLTSKQAAEFLGYTEATLRYSRVNGELGGTVAPKHYKKGRRVLYKASDLDQWVQDSEDGESA